MAVTPDKTARAARTGEASGFLGAGLIFVRRDSVHEPGDQAARAARRASGGLQGR